MSTTTRELSPRAKRAIGEMQAGAYFRKALESTWQGREQFATRLRRRDGSVVKGIGFATQQELENAGMLQRKECVVTSAWPTEWALREVPLTTAQPVYTPVNESGLVSFKIAW